MVVGAMNDAPKETMTTMKDDTKPSHRKLWHDLVDRAVQTAMASGTPFTVERVLDSVGIHSLSLHRERAFEYANKMLDAHRKATTQEAQL
jgi:hypothetical protein